MRRIAISQRVDHISSHGERRDALDQRWARLLEPLRLLPVPVPNGLQDPQTWAQQLGIEGLLLSGGNDLNDPPACHGDALERDRTESLLLQVAVTMQWPVLGVCRGMQMINVHLGGRVTALQGHVAVRHRLHRTASPATLLSGLSDGLEVNSFHRFGIASDGLASAWTSVLGDDDGFAEAAEHRTLPWAGIMWHPEREATLAETDRTVLSRLFHSP